MPLPTDNRVKIVHNEPATVRYGEMAERMSADMTATFRIITGYDPGTDGYVTNLSVLVGAERHLMSPDRCWRFGLPGDQFSTVFYSSEWNMGQLMHPKSGVSGSAMLMASPRDLIDAMRGLADKLEQAIAR